MKRSLVVAPLLLLLLLAVLLSGDDSLPKGRYRRPAKAETLRDWKRDYETKRRLVPPAPVPPDSARTAVDFAGVYRFGRYDYALVIRQKGNEVTFRSGGVDRQFIGGAFETVGAGSVRDGRIEARWWCIDLTRNFANNGGAEMWFHKGDRNRIYVAYYHDADERVEEGYGVRLGTHAGEVQHYRIRRPHPVKKFAGGLVLQGTVRSRGGEPIEDAVVMLRHEERSAVRTDRGGRWSIRVTRLPTVQMLSAAAPGYGSRVEALIGQRVRRIEFVLDPSPFTDDPRYAFIDPTPNREGELWRCGNCHRNSYAEWKSSRHALTARNVVTRAVYERDFLPALARGDALGDAGLCAACHAPSAALDGRRARLTGIGGVARRGNHCDFCHKIHHTDEIGAPGVRGSLGLGRPSPDGPIPGPIKRVYGPLADSDYLFMGAVYHPYFTTSALCAGCHEYTTEKGLPALHTYSEWRRWAATQANPKSCQGCHMTTGTSMEQKELARRICVNALRRPPEQIHDHSFLGRPLVVRAVELEADATRAGGLVEVVARVRATGVGHRVPTGSADKHLLLAVVALDGEGRPYALARGPLLPAHAGGEGDPLGLPADALRARVEAGDWAGLPGREFAQVLVDKAGRTHVPFWRAVKVQRDTRLRPDRPVSVRFAFRVPAGRPVLVRVALVHRLRFKRHDVAAGLEGAGVRPLDQVVAEKRLKIR